MSTPSSAATLWTSAARSGAPPATVTDGGGTARPSRDRANMPPRISTIEPIRTPMNTRLRPRSTNSRRAISPTPLDTGHAVCGRRLGLPVRWLGKVSHRPVEQVGQGGCLVAEGGDRPIGSRRGKQLLSGHAGRDEDVRSLPTDRHGSDPLGHPGHTQPRPPRPVGSQHATGCRQGRHGRRSVRR